MDSKPTPQHPSVKTEARRLEPTLTPALSFEQIYRAEFAHVWRFLYRLGCRGQTADDLTHDVFLMAFRKFETFDLSKPARPWLLGIAFRMAADFRELARHHREVEVPEDFESRHEDDSLQSNPMRHLEQQEAKKMIAHALSALSMEHRVTFVLHDLEQHSIPEVAEIVGIPVPTAYTRLRTARAKFTLALQTLEMRNGVVHD